MRARTSRSKAKCSASLKNTSVSCPVISPTRIMAKKNGLKAFGYLPRQLAMSRPWSKPLRMSLSMVAMAGLTDEDSSPAMARKIGTPALLRVYIWRENSRTSVSLTRARVSCVHQSAPPVVLGGLSRAMSTGTTPMASSCSATLCSVRASSWPCTDSPRLSRPRQL